MKAFEGKVAVITGAAAGIGRAIAERCAKEGMRIMLADIDENKLSQTQKEMEADGTHVQAIVTDVSKIRDIEVLAEKALSISGTVDFLCNNAGIGAVGDFLRPVWESPVSDWEKVMSVNLWGVIYGIQTFVPIMLTQNTECHIVNTASAWGLTIGSGNGAYRVSKHAVVSFSETLYRELAERNAKIKISVLCPMGIKSSIAEPLLQDFASYDMSGEELEKLRIFHQRIQAGRSPAEVADCVFNAIESEQFYILFPSSVKDGARNRLEHILQDQNPIS